LKKGHLCKMTPDMSDPIYSSGRQHPYILIRISVKYIFGVISNLSK